MAAPALQYFPHPSVERLSGADRHAAASDTTSVLAGAGVSDYGYSSAAVVAEVAD
jgi:hypothetical protein